MAASSNSTEFASSKGIVQRGNEEAPLACFTPFVVCLASGDLNTDRFCYFVAQNLHILPLFETAFQTAEHCTDEDVAKNAFAHLRDTVSQELKNFDSFVQDWDSDLIKQSPLDSATTKYIDFLSAITSGRIDVTEDAPPIILSTPSEKTRIAPYVLAAIASCMKFYLTIANKLKGCRSDHPYKKWIDKYSSSSYEILVQILEHLLDTLTITMTTDELHIVEKIYLRAMRLKMEFLTSQTLSQRTVIPLCKDLKSEEWHLFLFSAFDLTCSKQASTTTLAQLSISNASDLDQNQPGSQITAPSSATVVQNQLGSQTTATSSTDTDLKKTWNSFLRKRRVEASECIYNILRCEKESKFSYDRLCKALEFVSVVETITAGRAINLGILKGVNDERIKEIDEGPLLQEGCSRFLKELVQKKDLKVNVSVVSCCWSGDLIRSVFSSAGGLQAVEVVSNELEYDNSVTTGGIIMKIGSPLDKVIAFNTIRDGWKDNNEKILTVYIGHSLKDLLCLLKADIGIVIGLEAPLKKVGDHFAIKFVPLFTGLVAKQKECSQGSLQNWNALSGLLYTASSWDEIRAFILGL